MKRRSIYQVFVQCVHTVTVHTIFSSLERPTSSYLHELSPKRAMKKPTHSLCSWARQVILYLPATFLYCRMLLEKDSKHGRSEESGPLSITFTFKNPSQSKLTHLDGKIYLESQFLKKGNKISPISYS